MSKENEKQLNYLDSWAVFEACKAYNKCEITIDQLDFVILSATGSMANPETLKRVV